MEPATTILAPALAKEIAGFLSKALGAWWEGYSKKQSKEQEWKEIAEKILEQTTTLRERYSRITTVAFPSMPVDINSIYVPLTLEQKNKSPKEFEIDRYPKSLLRQRAKILIVDVAGMGKSTISKILFIKSLDENAQLPILVDLRRLSPSKTIEQNLLSQFGASEGVEEVFSRFLRTAPLLFLLDGFDEIAEQNKLACARSIRDFVDRTTNATFVITSRPELAFSDYTDFSMYQIKPLTKKKAHDLISRYGEAYDIKEPAAALLQELKAHHDSPTSSFLTNPLLTSLLFRAFEYKSVIPLKRAVFYKQVFDALFEAHDLSKETGYVREKKTGLHHDDFERVLRALASLFRKERVVEITAEAFKKMAESISKDICPDLAFRPEHLLHDVTHAVPIFIKDGNLVRWSHKSMLDFFLCEFLLRDYVGSKEDALWKSAFGEEGYSNQNFLLLVQESDPVLFAKAVTVPALQLIVKRNNEAMSLMPDEMEIKKKTDISSVFASYEVLLSSSNIAMKIDSVMAEASATARTAGMAKMDEFFLRFVTAFGQPGFTGIFMHRAAAALATSVQMKVVAATPFFDVARMYQATDEIETPFPKRTKLLFGWRKSAADWSTIEEDFEECMVHIGSVDEFLIRPSEAIKAIVKLKAEIAASTNARSVEIF